MIFVLGLADIMAGLIFLSILFSIKLPLTMLLFFSLYLVVKGGIFVLNSGDAGSFMDVLAGFVLLATIFLNINSLILLPFAVFLLGKGLVTLTA